MVCYTSCVLSMAFISASIFVILNTEKDEKIQKLLNELSPIQKQLYFNIQQERRMIYTQGFIGGFILSLIALYFMKEKMNRLGNLCMVGAITFTFSYFFYILSPKKYSMIESLDEKQDRVAWWEVYKVMQKYYHVGFIFGLLAVIFFCNIFLK